MTSFPLKIVTPDGLIYDGPAEQIIVRTITGDMAFLARHINCVAPLGMGCATVIVDGDKRHAACIGGMISVVDGNVTLVPTTFEWADSIDVARAEASQQRAEDVLHKDSVSDTEIQLAQARLHRALVRKNVASFKY
ncbi:MAG: ATP synthase F1 subunit epsilon [Oscillospiraceae bacterium]|nr:ATP synthase F1 subunit epsilon [Oscillospiraceae bacterium]